MKLSKPLGILTGLAVAVGSISPFCCSYSDIPVHADLGDLSGTVDYILSATGDEAIAASTGGNAVVRGIMLGIYLCTRNPLPVGQVYDAGNITVIDGLYKYNDTVCIGYEWFTNNTDNYSNDQPFVFATSKDFTISLSGSITGITSQVGFNRYFTLGVNSSSNALLAISNSSNANLFTSGSYSAQSYSGQYYYLFYGDLTSNANYYDWDLYPNTSLSSIFNVDFASCTNVIRPQAIVTLPSGDLDPADPYPYINNVVRPYVEENYPDYIDLVPSDDPTLPTSPSIDFTIPTADLSPLDPSEVISDYSTPVSFWWALTSDVLDTTGLKWLALFGFSCAIFAYIIWRLGR